jgi:H+/Cl- antiporter ClcA
MGSSIHVSLLTVLLFIIIIAVILFILGMCGYHWLFNLDWVNSFYVTALTMAGLSLEVRPKTRCQKIFVAIFTLLSVGFYLIVIATVIASILEPALERAVEHAEIHNTCR